MIAVRIVGSTTKWPTSFHYPMDILNNQDSSKLLGKDEIESFTVYIMFTLHVKII